MTWAANYTALIYCLLFEKQDFVWCHVEYGHFYLCFDWKSRPEELKDTSLYTFISRMSTCLTYRRQMFRCQRFWLYHPAVKGIEDLWIPYVQGETRFPRILLPTPLRIALPTDS